MQDDLIVADPYALFGSWLDEAGKSEPNDANAMSLATVDGDGMPSVRVVLLKDFDERGFVFYTNTESDKGRQLLGHPKAALCFHWKSLRRQVRVWGDTSLVSAGEADEYYHSRPRGSQIGAWASQQSRPLDSRATLERRVADFTAQYGVGEIPRPDHWTGFRIAPRRIEFWRDREFRLHDRMVYTRANAGWTTERLYP
ncbi:pyridoxamine 5'-phosphate oxidase [Radicibacter daui]|uniref:pyridoxamine 5'-phosphate oxidase n=1 Tax=Radicibacter daui TaxID=3064829 RepID=UPI004046F2AF